jgi:hypothetical protein
LKKRGDDAMNALQQWLLEDAMARSSDRATEGAAGDGGEVEERGMQ